MILVDIINYEEVRFIKLQVLHFYVTTSKEVSVENLMSKDAYYVLEFVIK